MAGKANIPMNRLMVNPIPHNKATPRNCGQVDSIGNTHNRHRTAHQEIKVIPKGVPNNKPRLTPKIIDHCIASIGNPTKLMRTMVRNVIVTEPELTNQSIDDFGTNERVIRADSDDVLRVVSLDARNKPR